LDKLNITSSRATLVFITATYGTVLSKLELNDETTIDDSTYAPGVYLTRTSVVQTVNPVKE
jgi:hypothetical protein